MSRRAARAGLVTLAALSAAACGVPLDAPQATGPLNACTGASACAAGASCQQGMCVATEYDLENLLVEVRPSTSAPFGANTSFLLDPTAAKVPLVARGAGGQPFYAAFNARLPSWVSIRGGRVVVNAATPLEPSCVLGTEGTVPAHVTFFPVTPYAGLSADPVAVSSDGAGEIDVDLVPGPYDVYVEPLAVGGCHGGKPYPPAFYAAQAITAGGGLSWVLPPLGTLTATITDFGAAATGPGTLDLVEQSRGLVISANVVTATPDGGQSYVFTADSAWDAEPSPILRLTPADASMPTAYWALSGAFFSGTHQLPSVGLSVAELYSAPIMTGGQVLGTDQVTGVAATLSIQSTLLNGPDGANASFAVQGLETDAFGKFRVGLPVGTYTFRAFPANDGLAVTSQTFAIPATVPAGSMCFCGQPFPLSPKVTLTGAVQTPAGERLAGVLAGVQPSQSPTPSYWQATHALAPYDTRAASITTSAQGDFALLVDPGTSDLVIQSAAGSGFPWLVRPRVSITARAELGSLALTSPAVLSGTVLDPDGVPVAGAEVNAWFPVRDPHDAGVLLGTVVQIATTTTDEGGHYTLVMPSSL